MCRGVINFVLKSEFTGPLSVSAPFPASEIHPGREPAEILVPRHPSLPWHHFRSVPGRASARGRLSHLHRHRQGDVRKAPDPGRARLYGEVNTDLRDDDRTTRVSDVFIDIYDIYSNI